MFDEAVKHFRSSLKCNPYLWSSFEALCHLGMFTVVAYPNCGVCCHCDNVVMVI